MFLSRGKGGRGTVVVASVDTCQDCKPVPGGYGGVTAPAGSWALLTPTHCSGRSRGERWFVRGRGVGLEQDGRSSRSSPSPRLPPLFFILLSVRAAAQAPGAPTGGMRQGWQSASMSIPPCLSFHLLRESRFRQNRKGCLPAHPQ